jgi:hypothetical protein
MKNWKILDSISLTYLDGLRNKLQNVVQQRLGKN